MILLSHTHYDHLDIPTAIEIGNKSLWIVPVGVKSILNKYNITNCVELNWWQTYELFDKNNSKVKITLTPAKHWSGRSLFDRNTCLWGSYVVHTAKSNFFFAGDTGYCPYLFKMIGQQLGPIDVSLLPIGSYNPRWFLRSIHCDPSDAVQIHLDLNSKRSIAMHWATFELASENYLEPALELGRARLLAGVSHRDMFTMGHGDTWNVDDVLEYDFAANHPFLFNQYLQKHELELSRTTAI